MAYRIVESSRCAASPNSCPRGDIRDQTPHGYTPHNSCSKFRPSRSWTRLTSPRLDSWQSLSSPAGRANTESQPVRRNFRRLQKPCPAESKNSWPNAESFTPLGSSSITSKMSSSRRFSRNTPPLSTLRGSAGETPSTLACERNSASGCLRGTEGMPSHKMMTFCSPRRRAGGKNSATISFLKRSETSADGSRWHCLICIRCAPVQ